MAENVLYADLNLPEPSRSRILTVPDVQDSGCTYAEVKVKSQDTNAAANRKSSGKSCCSRKCVALCVLVILVLVLAVCLIVTYGVTAGTQNRSTAVTSSSQNDSKTFSPTKQEDSTTLTPMTQQDSKTLTTTTQQGSTRLTSNSWNVSTSLSHTSLETLTKSPPSQGETPGCHPPWKKHGKKCYFFSPEKKKKDWNSSCAECAAMGSDLVIIESKEELCYLHSVSQGAYYLLGLRYSPVEQKWKWINNVEHDPAMFNIRGDHLDYHCTVIGYGEIGTAHCSGTQTTQNLCEKPARR